MSRLSSTAAAAVGSLAVLLVLLSLCFSPISAQDARVAALLPRAPFFTAHFLTNPAVANAATGYLWTPTDLSDNSTSNSLLHTGVITLSGASNSYVDLSQATGANSIGQTLPTVGGAGFGTGATAGWCFEIVAKPLATTTWAKLIMIGDGASSNDIILGWDGNDLGRWSFENWNGGIQSFTEVLRAPQVGQWYHVVICLQPVANATGATAANPLGNWMVYVNGALVNNSHYLVPSTTMTSVQGASYPVAVTRGQQYLGKSDWSDPYWVGVIDAFRVYDYVLNATTVSNIASVYGLNQPPVTMNASVALPASAELNIWQTAGLPTAPIFNAPFAENPNSLPGLQNTPLVYGWQSFDPFDNSSVQAQHKGIVTFSGSPTSYIDLGTTVGPTSCGLILPMLGLPGSGTGASAGMTVELVIKLGGYLSWSKIFGFSSGPGLDVLGATWDGNNYGAVEMQVYNNRYVTNATFETEMDFIQTWAPLHQWFHIAWVASNPNTNTWTATWTMYVNGQRISTPTKNQFQRGPGNVLDGTQTGVLPMPVTRWYNYLAASVWGDVPAAFSLDALRIYDYALTQTQVQAIATQYGLNSATPIQTTPPVVSNLYVPQLAEDIRAAQAVPRPALFNGSFSMNLSQIIAPNGGVLNYVWAAVDPSDSPAMQALHTGVIITSGNTGSYVDLSNNQGPNSVGLVMPTIGNAGFYPFGDPRQGMTFELVLKLNATTTWAKIMDIGDGAGIDDVVVGWDGNDYGRLSLQNLNNAAVTPGWTTFFMEMVRTPVLGQWYHMVVGCQAVNATAGSANWVVYINGQLQNWTSQLSPGVPSTFSAFQGGTWPQPIPRLQSYLGKSDWSDPYLAATFDAFRYYDYLLDAAAVHRLANIYGLDLSTTAPVSFAFPTTTETTALSAIVPKMPFFNLPFAQNPTMAPTVTSPTNYAWYQQDPTDVQAQQALHQGVLVINGGASSFVDLTTISGPNSVGVVMPDFGGAPTPPAGQAPGFSMEVVFKVSQVMTWSKLIALGTGPGLDVIALTWNGNDQGSLEMQVYNNWYVGWLGGTESEMEFVHQPVVNQWYHMVWVSANPNTTSWRSTWSVYLNGRLASGPRSGLVHPLPISRQYAWLGESLWSDPNANVTFDAIRMYDYALTNAHASALANQYGLYTGVSPDQQVVPTLTALGKPAPFFNADFQEDPTYLVSSGNFQVLGYQWLPSRTQDPSSIASYHQGIAYFAGGNSGTATYLDLSTATGPNSCGQALGVVGGPGRYAYGTPNQGWSFEMVVNNAATSSWDKIMMLGNGGGTDDIILTWDGADTYNTNYLAIQMYLDSNFPAYGTNAALKEIFKPNLNQWYHLVFGVQAVNPTQGSGNWYMYVNGQQMKFADSLVPGAFYTAMQGAQYPPAVTRAQSYLAKSDWGDANDQAWFDAFRVYDYLLDNATVQSLAALYGLNIPFPPQPNKIPTNGTEYMTNVASVPTPPIFSANFELNPASFVGPTSYQWLAQDNNDSPAVQAYHKGLLFLNGNLSSVVNLNLNTGPSSIGMTLPVFGGVGSGTGAARGLSIELVVKQIQVEGWNKLFNFGTGGGIDTMGVTWDGSVAQNIGNLAVQNYNSVPNFIEPSNNWLLDFVTPNINQWYHIAVVFNNLNLTAYLADCTVFVNGQKAANVSQVAYPLPIYRNFSYIGGSDWSDSPNPMLLDALRIYDYALTQAQVQTLASNYGLNSAAGQFQNSSNYNIAFSQTTEDMQVAAVLGRQPVFAASFGIDPRPYVGGSAQYTWMPYDITDSSPNQLAHKGLIQLSTSTSSYVDLNTNFGANSIGLIMPQVGGPGFYSTGAPYFNGNNVNVNQGWSFEVVVKFASVGPWAKMFVIGNQQGVDDIAITWDGNVGAGTLNSGWLGVQLYSNGTINPQVGYNLYDFIKPQLNQWYHIAIVFRPVNQIAYPQQGWWYAYVDGQKLPWSQAVYGLNNNGGLGNPPYAGPLSGPLQGAIYPRSTPRGQSYIGKSEFGDPTFAATFDAFRVYDYALNDTTVAKLAAIYGLNATVYTPPVSVPFANTTETTSLVGVVPRLPVFNAPFPQDPTGSVGLAFGQQLNYQWLAFDPNDTPANQALHRGLISLNGSAGSFIDLTTATGPNSCGVVLPVVGGVGSGTQNGGNNPINTRGMTVEMVFKLTAVMQWSKLIDIGTGGAGVNSGTGGGLDTFAITWNGNNFACTNTPGPNTIAQCTKWALEVQNFNGVRENYPQLAELQFLNQPLLNTWYHLAVVMQVASTATYSANWAVYVNGGLVATLNQSIANMPLPIQRNIAYIGQSDWTDPSTPMLVDTVRIYDYTLSGGQVRELASLYGLTNLTSGDSQVAGIVPVAPVFNGDFGANAVTPNALNWAQADPTDSIYVQQFHQGVIQLNGSANSYVDLSMTTGINSIGKALPVIGGDGLYGNGDPRQGWSIEVVVKFGTYVGTNWAKLLDLGDGANLDNIIITWDGNVAQSGRIGFQVETNSATFPLYNYAIEDFLTPVPGQWYHIVVEMQRNANAVNGIGGGAANWYVYVNGQQYNWADALSSGAFMTPMQGTGGTPYPQAIARPNSYLGKSDWGDPNFIATYDAFRVYNYLLNATTVQQLATAYGLYSTNPPIPVSYTWPASAESTMVNSLPGVTRPPIFNAAFSYDPTNAVGVGAGGLNYNWMAFDPADPQNALHQGIIQLNGSAQSFIDLSTNAGPNSCGLVLPVFGGAGSGSLANGTMGVTFDMVVKLNEVLLWSKLFDLGTGGYLNSLAMSWNGNNYGALEIQNYANVNTHLFTQLTELQFLSFPYTNTWYHLTFVAQVVNLNNFTANWVVYVNGIPAAQALGNASQATATTNYLLPVQRPVSFIGQSDWVDPSAIMTVDAFRIWDYVLSPSTVQAISAAYGITGLPSGPPPLQASYQYPATTEDRLVLAALGSARAPVFNISFGYDPTAVVGLNGAYQLDYNWSNSDPLDSPAQAAYHQGIVTFNGGTQSYIDLATNYGQNSYGQLLPATLFGATSGSGATAGWTFEIVVKFNATSSWGKIVDWGTGPYQDDFTLTWNGNDNGWICFENYNNASATLNAHSLVYIFRPVLGQWYHIMISMVQSGTTGLATYYIYVNGVQMNHADKLVTGAALTPIQGAAMPLNVWRFRSFLGKSDWNDAYFVGSIDSIRLYDYALSAQQAVALAAVYGLSTVPNWPYMTTQTNYNFASTTEATQVAAALSSNGQGAPVFNAMFPVNPATAIGATPAYTWLQQDPNDATTGVQSYHQGLVQITSANPSGYIDLSLATGPQSCGLALPIVGGAGSGTGANQGFSVEVVFKPTQVMTWQKFWVLGNGGGADTMQVGWWDTNAQVYSSIELAILQNAPSNQPWVINASTTEFGLTPVGTPINTWYHLVVVAQANQLTATTYSGTWSVYLNGTRLPFYYYNTLATFPAPFTPTMGGTFPFPIRRFQSYLGNSDWSADGTVNAIYDAFRVYDYALNAATVRALAAVYGLAQPQAPTAGASTAAARSSSAAATSTPVAPATSTPAAATSTPVNPGATSAPRLATSAPAVTSAAAPATSAPASVTSGTGPLPPGGGGSSSSGLSGGAIAGIVIGSVVGAALLCCVLFFFFCFKKGEKGEPNTPTRKDIEQMGNRVGKGYGQMEPSTAPSAAPADEESRIGRDHEVEMAEVGETGHTE